AVRRSLPPHIRRFGGDCRRVGRRGRHFGPCPLSRRIPAV
ncbi:MAG: hypothetical protein AVDCRST_MAG67-1409, partial [uncultured Solirubrobacteraceae bacterium]